MCASVPALFASTTLVRTITTMQHLPTELIIYITGWLPSEDILCLAATNRRLLAICSEVIRKRAAQYKVRYEPVRLYGAATDAHVTTYGKWEEEHAAYYMPTDDEQCTHYFMRRYETYLIRKANVLSEQIWKTNDKIWRTQKKRRRLLTDMSQSMRADALQENPLVIPFVDGFHVFNPITGRLVSVENRTIQMLRKKGHLIMD
jgi:hypothetical protein